MTIKTVRKAGLSFLGACLCLAAIGAFVMRIILIFTPYVVVGPNGSLVYACTFALFTYSGCLCFKTVFRDNSKNIMKICCILIFAAYLLLLSDFTLLNSFFGRSTGVFSQVSFGYTYALNNLNVIPFKTIGFYFYCIFTGDMVRIALTNILGNILAFMPFAIFLPLLFKKQRKVWVFILTTALISLLIELLQFALQVGSSDIDDIILNCGGSTLFFFIFHIKPVKKFINKITFLEY